jgi:hypothetical protein
MRFPAFTGAHGTERREAMLAEKQRLASLAGYRPSKYIGADLMTLRVLAAWRAGQPRHDKVNRAHLYNGLYHAPSHGRPSLWTDGVTVWSYGTAILQRTASGAVLFNATTYSKTTSRRQWDILEMVREEVEVGEPNEYGWRDSVRRWRFETPWGERFHHVHDVPIGTRDLVDALERQHEEVTA